MSFVRGELQSNQTNRWQAVGMLKHILASADVLWELKKHAINFLLCITNGNGTRNDGLTDCSIFLPSLCAASQVLSKYLSWLINFCYLFSNITYMFQAITKVIIYAPNTELRKNAYEALKRVRFWAVIEILEGASEPTNWCFTDPLKFVHIRAWKSLGYQYEITSTIQ